MTNASFRISMEGAVAELVLSRPDQLNALRVDFFREFPEAIAKLADAGDARVVILTAEGNHFCSGIDLSVFEQDVVGTRDVGERERFRRLALQFQRTISAVADCPLPVIATIHGACIGAGLDLVSACDFRYAVENASFCIHEINLGIMADLGTLQRLPKIMPEGIVRELAYTGERFDAKKGMQYGLINQVFTSREEMMDHARRVAQRIAQQSPIAIRASKESIEYVRSHSIEDSLLHAATLQSAIFDKEQIALAVAAQKQKSTMSYDNVKRIQ